MSTSKSLRSAIGSTARLAAGRRAPARMALGAIRQAHGPSHEIPNRQIPNPAEVAATTSPANAGSHIHSSGSLSTLPPASDHGDAAALSSHAPHQITPDSPLPSTSTSTSGSNGSGYGAMVRKFTPKGKPVYGRPPAPTSIPEEPYSPYDQPVSLTPLEAQPKRAINPDHPLWAFFHAPEPASRAEATLGGVGLTPEELRNVQASEEGEGLGSVEDQDEVRLTSARAWTAAELRQKSFRDLHTLWYILLRERNVLATQREERSRMNIAMKNEIVEKRAYRCRKSMARIKYVLNERRLALLAAAEATRPADIKRVKVHSKSPLGSADPMTLTGFEEDISRITWTRGKPVSDTDDSELIGDGERQKRNVKLPDEDKPVVNDAEVAKEEIEARDEGIGAEEPIGEKNSNKPL